MPLTDTAIRNAKPGDKPVKLFDGRGLFLIVAPSGGKWWRFRYKFNGKEKIEFEPIDDMLPSLKPTLASSNLT